MFNLIPEFKSGQKVKLHYRTYEDYPCPYCNIQCGSSEPPHIEMAIIVCKSTSYLIQCLKCRKIYRKSPEGYWEVKRENGIIYSIPYTLLEPIDESGE